ncbi:NUDIX domain-containing protein [Cognatiyoonia sp. IB215446]|uniref:NUDIX hydrolase n=1 Tax=Cognatiyoonia sp. IB215446 TaxID=3097355 RepID=UPI002A118B25|nr:NUDIX domain-containing protein [Cognatiyoonia sp. IB215446]MDX8350330.1 NUDIX domain-containing protein [Cognatiyoonia sp. IB215446]
MADLPIHSFSVSLVILREVAGEAEVLLLQRSATLMGEWCQITGTIEAEETAWQAALREMREETGLTPLRFYSADICEQFYEPHRNAITLVPVFVAFVDYDVEIVLNPEHSGYKWVSLDWAEDMVAFGGQRRVLRHVKQEFVVRDPNEALRIAF